MANNVFIMEAANLFCGDIDPSKSNHLTLSELKLPTLEENMVDHIPGGAPVGVEIDTHINKLEATFNLAGWSTNVMTMIGNSVRAQQVFTAYGVIRDRRSGLAIESKAVIGGRLSKVSPGTFKRGDLQHHEYAIRSIMSYTLEMDHQEIYAWDFFLNQRRIGGVDLNADINQILRIPVAAP
jgi:uncharacterized protein